MTTPDLTQRLNTLHRTREAHRATGGELRLLSEVAAALADREHYRTACIQQAREIEQTLGRALGFPWYKDDPENFPGATEESGVCVGEHTAESLALLAAEEIQRLRLERTQEALDRLNGADTGQDVTL